MQLEKLLTQKTPDIYNRTLEPLPIVADLDGCIVDVREFTILNPTQVMPSGDYGHRAVAKIDTQSTGANKENESFNLFVDVVLPVRLMPGAKITPPDGTIAYLLTREYDSKKVPGTKERGCSLKFKAAA